MQILDKVKQYWTCARYRSFGCSSRGVSLAMVVDFDIDGDGKVTLEEVAMKERMLEIELREEKAESQKKMAWVAMLMMIGFTAVLFYDGLISDSRVNALADLFGLFYIAQTGIVAAYMGATAYMAGKPMGNKVAMSKDMR
jgi:hypothetical protein